MEYIRKRITRLRNSFSKLGIDALFVVNPMNVFYLSGFTGDGAYILITYDDIYFITDPRYQEQIKEEIPEYFKKIVFFEKREERVLEFLRSQKIKKLGIEERRISYYQYKKLKNFLHNMEIIEVNGIIEGFRMIKDEHEIGLIKKAIEISLKAMNEVICEILEGMSEKEISAKFAYLLRIYGGEKESFDTIVASGYRGALPHGMASEKIIRKEDVTVIDFGVRRAGYDSDTTRTIKLMEPTPLEKEIYNIVREAQERAISAVKPGMKAKDLDKVARDYIMSKGYGNYFGHGLGHGVGIDIHEEPYISPTSDAKLLPNMIITIEPGIYLPGEFGIRIEDMVLVTESGGEVLTNMKKELMYK